MLAAKGEEAIRELQCATKERCRANNQIIKRFISWGADRLGRIIVAPDEAALTLSAILSGGGEKSQGTCES